MLKASVPSSISWSPCWHQEGIPRRTISSIQCREGCAKRTKLQATRTLPLHPDITSLRSPKSKGLQDPDAAQAEAGEQSQGKSRPPHPHRSSSRSPSRSSTWLSWRFPLASPLNPAILATSVSLHEHVAVAEIGLKHRKGASYLSGALAAGLLQRSCGTPRSKAAGPFQPDSR